MDTTQIRVALVHESSLLAEAVQSLLEGDDVSVLSIDLGQDHAADRIRDMHPSVVVIDADDVAFHDCTLIALLEKVPNVKLVCLHGGGDHLDVYSKTRVAVRGSRDLASAIGAT